MQPFINYICLSAKQYSLNLIKRISMKNLILTIMMFTLGALMVNAQTQNNIQITGTVFDANNNSVVPGITVDLSADSIYNSSTNSYWSYSASTSTDSLGQYSFKLTIPNGINNAELLVSVSCSGVSSVQRVYFPSAGYNNIDFYCGGQTKTCMAYFSYKFDPANHLNYSFYDNSYGNISSWKWNFGDGASSSLQNPVHNYLKDGIYDVSLVITDTTNNCTDSITMYIDTKDTFIFPKCKAYFYYYPDPRDSFTIIFMTDSMNYPAIYTWDLGDNTSATGNYVTHQYKNKGKYNVCMVLYDSTTNCLDTFCETITVPFKLPCYSFFYYKVNGDTVTFYADKSPSNTAKYIWNFGDGTGDIDSNSVKKHVYTKKGYYEVCLTTVTLNDSCYEYCDFVSTDTFNNNRNLIGGMVYLGLNNTADIATVYLIQYNPKDSMISALDSTVIDSGGFYYFDNVASGNYYLKAALSPKSNYYYNYLPTYFDSTVYWNNAIEVNLDPNNNKVWAEIFMVAGSNPGGPGFIGGKVNKGSNYRSDYLKGILVILFDAMNKPVAYTYSDDNGDFAFKNIALGTYQIYADHFGIECTKMTVTLTETNKSINNVQIVVDKAGIKVSVEDLLPGLIESAGQIYPVPAKEKLYFELTAKQQLNMAISIINLLGEQLYSSSKVLTQGKNLLEIPVNSLDNGIYLLNLNIEGKGNLSYRFVKVD